MKIIFSPLLFLLITTLAFAATDFSGTWSMNVSKGKNLGMMENVQITLKIKQTASEITVSELSKFNGQEQTRELHYDLSGRPVSNNGPMGDSSETVSKWVGSSVETTWTQEGAIAGTKVERTETRSVSPDGKTMTDEFVRGSNPPVILVFDKQ